MTIKAEFHHDWGIEVLSCRELYYDDGADPDHERPHNVRAGSGLMSMGSKLVAIQDDADFLAVIEPDGLSVKGYAIPVGSEEHNLYDDSPHTAEPDEKIDLEACLSVPWGEGSAVLAVGSGVQDVRRKMVVCLPGSDDWGFQEIDTSKLHEALDTKLQERGACLNIEGAVMVDKGTLRLFSRGDHGDNPQDATFDLAWDQVEAYIRGDGPVPSIPDPVYFDLGELDGRKLTFSDAEAFGEGQLVTVSSEGDDESGGSLLGLLRGDELMLARGCGFPLSGKIEGVCCLEDDPERLFLIEDQDDCEKASRLYEVRLTGSWANVGKVAVRR